MNLSNLSLADDYAQVRFDVDEKNTVIATQFAHALTIPNNARHKMAAKEFAKMFLDIDKTAEGFLSRSGVFGKDPLS